MNKIYKVIWSKQVTAMWLCRNWPKIMAKEVYVVKDVA